MAHKRLSNALDRHDGSLLNNVSQLGQDDVIGDGQKILAHILGGKQRQTEQRAGENGWRQSGSDRAIAGDGRALPFLPRSAAPNASKGSMHPPSPVLSPKKAFAFKNQRRRSLAA